MTDPSRGILPAPSRALLDATAQGLVRFDAAGGIEPGLAERWIVIDDGMSVIFRLRDAEWPDGSSVTADQVVPALRRATGQGSRNTLGPYLTAIEEIVAMTPQVIEVRLSRPRPDILKLFAQPELAIPAPDGRGGSGPFRIQRGAGTGLLLRPGFDPLRDPDEEAEEPSPEQFVRIYGERASVAILRFAQKRSDLVDGGTVSDWPLVGYAGIAPANIRFDSPAGLFGLAVARRGGFFADPANRAAIALAIDRAALAEAVQAAWPMTETLLPEQLDSSAPPVVPEWASTPVDQRANAARARADSYRAANPGPITVRIALPGGPGGTQLFGVIGVALRRMGLDPVRVWQEDRTADLRLVDQVAPYDSARWYLRSACQPCARPVARLIADARDAPTLARRAELIAQADAALAEDVAFIPIGRPLRWSLVATRLRAWAPNARAFHPLNHLRAVPN